MAPTWRVKVPEISSPLAFMAGSQTCRKSVWKVKPWVLFLSLQSRPPLLGEREEPKPPAYAAEVLSALEGSSKVKEGGEKPGMPASLLASQGQS